MKSNESKLRPPATINYIKKLQLWFLACFALLQVGLYYKNGYIAGISFLFGFFLGLYWVILLIKKNRYDRLRETEIEEEELNSVQSSQINTENEVEKT